MNLSGPLSPRLFKHATERARHLFLFLFCVDAACRTTNARLGSAAFRPLSMIQEAATHQIDSGLREPDNDERAVFDRTDSDLSAVTATADQLIDAAHYCNLGLTAQWAPLKAKEPAMTSQGGSTPAGAALDRLTDMAETFTANTGWLPQQVNIGPDRTIDRLHFALACDFFRKGGPIASRSHVDQYLKEAIMVMSAAQVRYLQQKKRGLASCCAAYLAAYNDGDNVEDLVAVIVGNIRAECEIRQLKPADYLG